MKVVIIEDEPLAAARTHRLLLEADPGLQIAGQAGGVRDGLELVRRERPDLLLLDIHLGDGTGFQLLRQLEEPPPVIFTTAFDQYALDAFRENSVAYLLKPFNAEDIRAALKKWEWLRRGGLRLDQLERLILRLPEENKPRQFLVQTGEHWKLVALDQVAYFFAQGKFTFLVTHGNDQYLMQDNLTRLEQQMGVHGFFRVNRQYLLKASSISRLTPFSKSRWKLELRPSSREEVIVSSEKSAAFKEWLRN